MKIACIADIHFGALDSNKLYHELDKIFLDYLRNNQLDMIVICGDLYHSRISFNSNTARLSIYFIYNLISIAENTGIKYIRIISGTLSHDNNQLENLKVFENSNIDFKIINSVYSETIENEKILYLPEEYVTPDYYNNYFNKKYDYIFGHGLVTETAFESTKQNSEITMKRSIVFDSELLCKICNKYIIFGHIHKSQNIKNKIYYTGSFSRWVYGEEDPKGFLIIDDINISFIENTLAEKYDTLIIMNLSDYESAEELINYCKSFCVNHLRIKIFNDNSPMINILSSYYSTRKEYSLIITTKEHELSLKKMDKNNELMEKYDFIFSNSIPKISKISRFIFVRDKEDVSNDFISELLGG